jgi:hypothetical protein
MMVIELPSPPKLLHPSVIRNASNILPAVVVGLLGDVFLDPAIREAHIEKTSIRLSHLVDELFRREEAQPTQTIPNVNRAEGGGTAFRSVLRSARWPGEHDQALHKVLFLTDP